MPGLPGAPGVVQQGNSFTNVPGPTPAATAAGAGIHPTADPRAAVVQAALAGLRANGIIPSQLHATPVANVYEQGGNNFTNANALNAAGVPGPWAPPVPAAAPAPIAAPIAPIAAPVAVVPTVAPAVAAAQASPIETGLSGAWHGLEGGVNALAGGLLAAGGKVTGLPGLTAAGNKLMGVGRAAFDKQNAQTQALHQATGPESYIGQGINELGNYLNPVTAPIYAGMSTANMANGRGGLKTVGGSALAALAAAIPGEELLSAAGHPAESLASSAVSRIAQALGKNATPLAQRIGQVGVSSLLGGASNAAIQVGQNIATRSPTMQGVPEAAALGGVALAGGTAVAHGLGAVVGKFAKKTPGEPFPVDTNLAEATPETTTEPPSVPASASPGGVDWDAILKGTQKPTEAPAAAPAEAPIAPPPAPVAPVAPMVNGDGSPLLESVPDFSKEPGMGEPEAPIAAAPATVADNLFSASGLKPKTAAGKFLMPLLDAAHAEGATHESTVPVAQSLLAQLDSHMEIGKSVRAKLGNALNQYVSIGKFNQRATPELPVAPAPGTATDSQGVTDKTTPVNIPDSGLSAGRPSPVVKSAPAQDVAPESASAQNAAPDDPVVAQAAIKNPTDPKEEALVGQSKQGLENIAEDANSKVEQHAAQKMLDKGVVDSKPEPVDTSDIAPLVDTLNNTPKPEAPIAPEVAPSGKPVKASVKKAAAAAAQKALIESNRVKAQAALATRAASKGTAFVDPELNKTLNAFQNKQAAYDPSAEPTRAEKDQANALAAKIAAHPEVSKRLGRIHDIREMTDYAPLDASQLKRAIIATRKTFGDKVQTRVADMSQPGRRGETDLEHIYLAAHALHHGLSTFHHEAWHIIREKYLTTSERSMMDKSIAPGTRRYKMLEEWGKTHHGPAVQEQIRSNPTERPALYAEALMSGGLPKPTGMIGRLFAKVQNGMDAIKASLHGAGFNSTDDLVQKGFAGGFKNREHSMSTADANDRIDAEQRGGVPRDVYERALHGATDDLKKKVYPTAPDVNYHITEGQEAPKSGHLSGVGKFTGEVAARFEPLYTKALHNPRVREIHQLMVERGENARKTIAQAVHIAPHFLSPHVMDNLKGLLIHKKVFKALKDGDHFRKVFTDPELAERGLNAKDIGLYREFLAGREPGLQSMLGEDKVQHDTHMAVLSKRLEAAKEKLLPEARFLADPATPDDKREELTAHIRETLLPIMKDMEDEDALHEAYKAHIDRLRTEGYIPHDRTGAFMGHIQKWMPQSLKHESDLNIKKEGHLTEKARLEQELGMTESQSAALYAKNKRALSLDAAHVGGEENLAKVKELLAHHRGLDSIKKELGKLAEQRADPDFEDPLVRLPDLSARDFNSVKSAQKDNTAILAEDSPQRREAAKLGITLKDGGVTSMDAPAGGSLTPKQIYQMLDAIKAASGGTMTPEEETALLRQAGAARSQAMKELVNRADTAGEGDDLVHALSTFTGYHAHAYASAKVSSALQTALHNLNDPQLGSPEDAKYVSQWLDGLSKAEVSKDQIMSKARAAGMYMMLGGRLPAPLFTLGSNSQMAMAHLARNEGIPAADWRYAKALKDTALLTPKRLARAVAAEKGIGAATPAEIKALHEAHLRGITDAQYAYLQDNANPHVKGAAAGARLSRAAATALMSPLATVESRLRQATYLAALRQHADLTAAGKTPLMSAMGADKVPLPATDPTEYAKEMTKLSNQSFEPEDQPPAFNLANGDGKTLFMFQGPMLQMAYTLAHLARTNPKMFATAMAGTTALGGVTGLPMYSLVMNLLGGANQMSAQMGGPSVANSPSTEVLKELDKVHPGLANLAQHGLPDEILQHIIGKTAPDVAPYFQIGSAGDGIATALTNTMIRAAGGEPATKAAPIPLMSMFKDILGSAGAIPDAIKTGDTAPILRHGFGDTLAKALYETAHAANTGERTNAEGTHPYAVTPGEIAENALGVNSIRQNDMFNTIGQRDYRAGMRKLVLSQMGTLIKDAANDGSPKSAQEAMKLGAAWDSQHPSAPAILNPQTVIQAEMAARENPVLAQMLRDLRSKTPMGLKTYGTN